MCLDRSIWKIQALQDIINKIKMLKAQKNKTVKNIITAKM